MWYSSPKSLEAGLAGDSSWPRSSCPSLPSGTCQRCSKTWVDMEKSLENIEDPLKMGIHGTPIQWYSMVLMVFWSKIQETPGCRCDLPSFTDAMAQSKLREFSHGFSHGSSPGRFPRFRSTSTIWSTASVSVGCASPADVFGPKKKMANPLSVTNQCWWVVSTYPLKNMNVSWDD